MAITYGNYNSCMDFNINVLDFLCPRNKKFEIIGVVLLFIVYDFVVMKNGYIFWLGFISLMGTPIFIIIAYQLKKLYLRNKKYKNDKKITDIHIP